MKRIIAIMLAAVLLILLPVQAMAAKSKKMDADVPVWTEETVRAYLEDYINGQNMDLLYSYYDLQIRRYLPEDTFASMLTELGWLTGEFICLGDYTSFEESERKSMTHVVHLHMEKQDLDVYFTHKNQEDDWEVMALEFVPAEKQEVDVGFAVGTQASAEPAYTELPVTIGEGGEYPLSGILTLPEGIEEGKKVPACVLVHDAGPLDLNASVGATRFFEYLARELADMGVASIRYDKRTFTYGETADMTVAWEVVEDAVLAARLLAEHEQVDSDTIIIVGHGFGGLVTPRIAQECNANGMILIGSRPETYARQLLEDFDFAGMSADEEDHYRDMATNMGRKTEEAARSIELFGKNGYYFWEMEQYNPLTLITRLSIPTYVVQGRNDATVTENEGWRMWREELKNYGHFMKYNSYRGLNHMLANDLSVDENGNPQYAIDAGIDITAVRDLANWMLSKQPVQQTETLEAE